RSFLYFCDARWDTNYHSVRSRKVSLMSTINHFYHAPDHLFSCMEIGYNPILQWTYGFDIFMRFLRHLLCLPPYGQNLISGFVYRNDRRLVYHNLLFMNNKGIGGTQIDGNVTREKIK